MTGSFLMRSTSADHQTAEGHQEYHLHDVKGEKENGDGSTTGLLHGIDGGESEGDASISASRVGQQKGKTRRDDDPIKRKLNLDTRAARRTLKEPPAVSFRIDYYCSYCCLTSHIIHFPSVHLCRHTGPLFTSLSGQGLCPLVALLSDKETLARLFRHHSLYFASQSCTKLDLTLNPSDLFLLENHPKVHCVDTNLTLVQQDTIVTGSLTNPKASTTVFPSCHQEIPRHNGSLLLSRPLRSVADGYPFCILSTGWSGAGSWLYLNLKLLGFEH